MAAGNAQTFSIFVPLVFVVVTQLSGVVKDEQYERREGDDLQTVDRRPILFPQSKYVPSFGRLNAIHGLNLLLLRGCFVLSVALLSGLLRSVLVVLLGLVWVTLPLLETDAFGEILESNTLPTSIYFHILMSVASMTHLAANVTATERIQQFDLLTAETVPVTVDGAAPLVVGAGMFLLEWYGFLKLLAWDIDCGEASRAELLKTKLGNWRST